MKSWQTKAPPETQAQIDMRKKQIGVMLDEYEQAINDATAWFADWKARNIRRGFRCASRETSGGVAE